MSGRTGGHHDVIVLGLGSMGSAAAHQLAAHGRPTPVVPSVAGQAWITQLCQVGVDPSDPFPSGYTLADTWGAAPRRAPVTASALLVLQP